MAEELLAVVRRGDHCPAEARAGSLDDSEAPAGTLLCNLRRGHPGPLHFDHIDQVWWATDFGGGRG